MRRESKLPLIIIIVLVVIVLGLGLFICIDKGVFSPKESEPVVKEKDYDLSKAKKLVDKYFIVSLGNDSFSTGLTEEIKEVSAIFNTDSKYKSQISCQVAYQNNTEAEKWDEGKYTVKLDLEGQGVAGCDENLVPFYDYDAVNETYKELFGEKTNMPKEAFNFEGLVYDYIEEQKGFVQLTCRCGGGYFNRVFYFVKSAKVNEDKLTIDIAYVNMQPAAYDDSNDPALEATIGDEKVTYKFSDTFKDGFEDEFSSKYLDKLQSSYELTFDYEDDHYVLTKMSKK